MLTPEAGQNLLRQIGDLWVNPEIERRKKTGRLPPGFKFKSCLVKLPLNRPPIVQFNEEVSWVVEVTLPKPRGFRKGEPIYAHDIKRVKRVKPPVVDGQRVAFIWLRRAGSEWEVVFDFSPNVPEELRPKGRTEDSWSLGDAIGDMLQDMIVGKVIDAHDSALKSLRKIGLWAAPALLPYPLSEICRRLQEGDDEGALQVLVEHCNPAFLFELCAKWSSVEQFRLREELIDNALQAHKQAQYTLSIPAVLPQIESIISDWISTKVPPEETPWRPESKTKKFRDLALQDPPSRDSYRRIVESAIDFIVDGPMLATFKRWFDVIDAAFPNRHAVGHGKYDPQLFCEANSLRLFLLLDTVYYIISGQTPADGQATP